MAESTTRSHHPRDYGNNQPEDFFSDTEVEAAMQLIQLSEEDSDCTHSARTGSSSIGNPSAGAAESIIASNSITESAIRQREEQREADPETPSSRAVRRTNIFTRGEEGEDQSDRCSRRRKTRKKLRSVHEIYSLTKPVVLCKYQKEDEV